MFYKNKKRISLILTIAVLFVFVFPLVSLADWSNPTSNPASNNTPKPINVGDDFQFKTGSLRLGGNGNGPAGGALTIVTGNVGIGTINAQQRLHVVGSNHMATFENTSATANHYSQISLKAGTATNYLWTANQNSASWGGPNSLNIYAGAGGAMTLWTNATEKMRITTAGNIGIGTPNPSSMLTIYESDESTTQTSFTQGLSNAGINIITDYTVDAYTPGLFWSTQNNNPTRPKAGIYLRETAIGTYIHMSTSDNYNVGIKNNSFFMRPCGGISMDNHRIDSLSNAIRDTDALPKGQADGLYAPIGDAMPTGTVNGQTIRYDGSDWIANTVLFNNGTNIGIGTTNPGAKLEVAGGAWGTGIVINTNATSGADLRLNNSGAGGRDYHITSTGSTNASGAGNLQFYDEGAALTRLVINASGNVGIGTTNPSTYRIRGVTNVAGWGYRFDNSANGSNVHMASGGGSGMHINGGTNANATAYLLDVYSANGMGINSKFRVMGDGKVGIGTALPEHNLHVYGGATSIIQIQSSGIGDAGYANLYFNNTSAGSGNAQIFRFANGATSWAGSNSLNIYNSNGPIAFHPNAVANALYLESTGYVGIGTADPTVELHVEGDVKITGELELGGADVAEEFVTDRVYEAGTVLVMGDGDYKSARACDREYDTSVVGVISDNASLIIGKVDSNHKAIVAMVGVVSVKINDNNGIIKKGDLLTTSGIYGEAMLASDPRIGTIIGKALEDSAGKEEIMALVNLQ